MQPPVYEIDPKALWQDPYPDLARMRAMAPVVYVPQLDALLITRRDDIFEQEKKIDVFSSDQPGGLMTLLMGENMMRKDGAAHKAERRAIFPTVSPKTVKQHWVQKFRDATGQILDDLAPRGSGDLVRDFAMPVSAEALKQITGLTEMAAADLDRVSQGMIDGCSNYAGDPAIEANCHECTALIDRHITRMIPAADASLDPSLLSVMRQAGLPDDQVRANIKLAISGGQNEPRDAIAGLAWALLTHPAQLQDVLDSRVGWLQAFEEYARWMSPIGMSPRRVARDHRLHGYDIAADSKAFLMFGSGNRDERVFSAADDFDIHRDTRAAISFGAGPHFCAGAWASKALIAEVAMPLLFARLPDLQLSGAVAFGGWAFRGPLEVPVVWSRSSQASRIGELQA